MGRFKRYNKRDMEQILKDNGWELDHQSGSHKIYKNDKGEHISIGCCSYNSMIFRRLAKENNLVLTK